MKAEVLTSHEHAHPVQGYDKPLLARQGLQQVQLQALHAGMLQHLLGDRQACLCPACAL